MPPKLRAFERPGINGHKKTGIDLRLCGREADTAEDGEGRP